VFSFTRRLGGHSTADQVEPLGRDDCPSRKRGWSYSVHFAHDKIIHSAWNWRTPSVCEKAHATAKPANPSTEPRRNCFRQHLDYLSNPHRRRCPHARTSTLHVTHIPQPIVTWWIPSPILWYHCWSWSTRGVGSVLFMQQCCTRPPNNVRSHTHTWR
jgi:hypothetical protein